MQNTLGMIQLAETINADRPHGGLRPASLERAPTIRTRLGRRVISLGERIAYGFSATATR